MAINRLTQDDIEVFTIETNPRQNFISTSSGITGGSYVYSRRSSYEKDPISPLAMSSSYFDDSTISSLLANAKRAAVVSGSNTTEINAYLSAAHNLPSPDRFATQMEVLRYTPGVTISKEFLAKNAIINNLMPFYRTSFETAHFNFTNYNCLNFFTASGTPSNSVLMYPQTVTTTGGVLSGSYIFQEGFTFDFWVKPKYTVDGNGVYKPGTIMHLSGAYAISLISGSSKDIEGNTDKFRILLQLSSSANISPTDINVSSLPAFCCVSDDNTLDKNSWNHVTVRWGTSQYNLGSGSFVVNEESAGVFAIPSASVAPRITTGDDNPTVLCVGNYYTGANTASNLQASFFAEDVALREGLDELSAVAGISEPAAYSFTHPLRAEISELKLYNRYVGNDEIISLQTRGPGKTGISGTLFYLPPFFTRESPTRQYYAGSGGVLVTPFTSKTGTTVTPFSVELSSEVGGHYMNLENYTRDFATGKYPRLFSLTASVVSAPSSIPATANQILYSTGSVSKRQMTVMPCDNGVFYPNYFVLSQLQTSSFANDLGNNEIGSVTLRNVYDSGSIFYGLNSENSSSINAGLYGPDPSDSSTFTRQTGSVAALTQRTRELDSNQVVMFDISNLFYGNQIKPGSISITDNDLSCSFGTTSMTLRDDKYGNIYRADCTGSHATWNSVGNVFYNEGLILLKNPALYFFGQNNFNISFQGEQTINTLRFRCTAFPLQQTKSTNKSYLPYSASLSANDYDSQFVYITELMLHDDNLNVIGRMKLAQPYSKRTGDKTTFIYQTDF